MKRILFSLLCLLALGTQAGAANDLTGNPLILDTAASTVITTGSYRVTSIVWACGTACAAADLLLLKNQAGAVVVDLVASAINTNYTITFPAPLSVSGLILTTIGHGKVYLYYDR